MKFAFPLFLAAATLGRGVDACTITGGTAEASVSGTTANCNAYACKLATIKDCDNVFCNGRESCYGTVFKGNIGTVTCGSGSSGGTVMCDKFGGSANCGTDCVEPQCIVCQNAYSCAYVDNYGFGNDIPDVDGYYDPAGTYCQPTGAPTKGPTEAPTATTPPPTASPVYANVATTTYSAGDLDETKYNLGQATITKVAIDNEAGSFYINKVRVTFEHGNGDGSSGTMDQFITTGDCPDGNNLPDSSNDGLTVETLSEQLSQTIYEITIDLNEAGVNLEAEINGGIADRLKLCLTHTMKAESGLVANFQQTQATIKYNMDTNAISGLTFNTAITSPDVKATDLDPIGAIATEVSEPASGAGTSYGQGERISFNICPDGDEEMFKIAALLDLKATSGDVPPQILTNQEGALGDDTLVGIFTDVSDADCLNIQFILRAEFFQLNTAVGVSIGGKARIAEKTVTTRRLSAENESRQLQTRVTEADIEMDVIVAPSQNAKSGSYMVTVSQISLLGVAGTAVLTL